MVLQRIFEIMPGLSSWTVLIGMTILSFKQAVLAAIIILAFDLYWLLKLFYMTFFLVISYIVLSSESKTDWLSRIKGLKNIDEYTAFLKSNLKSRKLKGRLSDTCCIKQLQEIKSKKILIPDFDKIVQLVIVPVVKESKRVIEDNVKSLKSGTFSAKQIVVVIALEGRAKQEIKNGINEIQNSYKNDFYELLVVTHKDNLEKEARVKGANITNAAKHAAGYLKEKHVNFDNVIMSCFDADTIVNPHYFACLTYTFMITQDRLRCSFQPVPVYNNNIWQVPGFARVLETGSSFFQLIEATNPEKLVTFSSHSMSFKALVECDYWPVDMISDDSAIYWKAFIHYDGKYRVVPIYTTVSMDIVEGGTAWRTVVDEYKQKRRWAWGVENFPLVMRAFIKDRKISFFKKIKLGFKLFEQHFAWATWAFLLTFIGWLPAIFAGEHYKHVVTYYNVPRITGVIFNLASISLIVSIILSILLLPKNKQKTYSWFLKIIYAFQWLLIPVIIIFISALPALDAQTRLMLGKRMEFWVADKRKT